MNRSLWTRVFLVSGTLLLLAGVLLHDNPTSRATPENNTLSPAQRFRDREVAAALKGLEFTSGRIVIHQPINDANDDMVMAWLASGHAHLAGNRRVAATAEFARAVRARPRDGEALRLLGQALERLGEVTWSESAYRSALDEQPTSVAAQNDLARLLEAYGRRDEAISAWHRALELDDGSLEALRGLALASYYDGELAASEGFARRLEDAGGTLPQSYATLLAAARGGEGLPRAGISLLSGSDPQVGPQARVDVGGGVEAANETSAAAVAVDGEVEIVATWNDWRLSGAQEIINMGVAVSLDGGTSWNDGLVRPPVPNQSTVEGDPMTAYDPRDGTLWVGAISFTGGGGLYVARKEGGEGSFQPSVQVQEESFADKCWMAAGPLPNGLEGTGLYIGYNNGLQRSFDRGDSWERISNGWPTGLGFLPRVGRDGTLYVSYWDAGFASGNHRIIKSTTGGTDFEPNVIIAERMDNWGSQDGSRFPGDFRAPGLGSLAIDPNDDQLFFVYPDTTNIVAGNSNVDLYFVTSIDGGDTWTNPRIINQDATPPGDQFFPWIEVDDSGRLHLVFHDSRNVEQDDNNGGNRSGFFDAYYAYSDDDGQSWREFRLTPTPFDSFDDGLNRPNQFLGDYNGLAIAAGNAYPTYLSNQNGDSDIFVHSILREGAGQLGLDGPDPGVAGQVNEFTVSGATPGVEVLLVAGVQDGSAQVPLCAELAVEIDSPSPLVAVTADAKGNALFSVDIPDAASGNTARFQTVEQSSCRTSNKVTFAFP